MPGYEPPDPRVLTFNFPATASASDWQRLGALALCNLRIPTGFQGTSLRVLSALAGSDGLVDAATALPLLDAAGQAVAVAITSGGSVVQLPLDALRGHPFISLVAYTAGSLQTQTTGRDVVGMASLHVA